MKFQFGVRTDVVSLGRHWEDGDEMIGYAGYVVAETENGRRWAHRSAFVDREPEGAEAKADMLLQRIEATGGQINLDHWDEIDPAYGSDAYQGLDNERYFRNREISDAHDAGEISETEALRLMMR